MNQEIVSIGISNIFGSFFSAYPMTGAFSRTAVMSKSGCRTPLTNILVGAIVVVTIYCFTPALQFIPDAAVGAIVCHAVTDLITGPKVWVKFWNTNPSELLIFAAAYIISLVARIDISVYVPVGISLVVQLFRVSRPKYAFLGRLDLSTSSSSPSLANQQQQQKNESATTKTDIDQMDSQYLQQPLMPLRKDSTLFFPLSDSQLHGRVHPISPGIICFQPRENLVFENINYLYGKLMDQIKKDTRRGKPLSDDAGARPWNDAGGNDSAASSKKPLLSSVILDLSGVHVMDYTGMEALAELSRMVDQYCGDAVPWFIVLGSSEMVRHALLYAGFGRQQRKKVPNGIFSFHNDIKKRRRFKNSDRATTSHSHSASGPSSAPHQHNYDEKISTMAIEDISEHRHQHASSSAPPTTEPLETPSTSPPPRSCSTISSDPLDTALPPWCYCQDDEDEDDDDENDDHRNSDGMVFKGAIVEVRDRYPYFFLSLHDAANAALHHLASTYPLCHYVTSQTLPNESVAIDMEKGE